MAVDNNMAEIKAQAREALHEAMGVPATYLDDSLDDPVDLTVRWHHKLATAGAMEGGWDVQIIEGIDRLVFSQTELDEALDGDGLTLRQKGLVTITGYGATYELDFKEKGDGPQNVYWTVIKRDL
jgi:hypothetical protein